MVGAFYTGVDEVGGSFEALFRLQMMEDLVGLLAGFVAGTVAAAVWKTLKRYGPPEQT
jgi:hypothetical protein